MSTLKSCCHWDSCLRCRAGVPGCGRRHISSGPRKAPPHGCQGWSAVVPAFPASPARVRAAQRSILYLEIRQVKPDLNLMAQCVLSCDYIKVKSISMAAEALKNSTACIWFQPDSCNTATFHSPLFSASNRILSWGGGILSGYLTKSLQFAWVEVIEEVE